MVAVPSRDSDNSSGHSTPEVHHRGVVSSHPQGAGGGLDPTRPHSQALDNPLYANLEHMQDKTKPPVPPRGSTGSNRSSRSSLDEGPIYQNRISVVPSYEVTPSENTYQNYPSDRPNGHRRESSENMNGDDLPPLPRSAPPLVMARPPVPPSRARYAEQTWVGGLQQPSMPHHGGGPHYGQQMGHMVSHHHQVAQHNTGQGPHFSQVSRVSHHQYAYTSQGSTHQPDITDGVPGSRQPYSEYSSRTMSLPQGSSLPPGSSVSVTTSSGPIPSHRYSATFDRQGLSESSSEGDVPVSTNKKEKEKKGSVFKFFGRRKGAQV
ncbi:hypothetical protein OTU49_007418 [Cherax quadricarinatus]|uniref:Uncharacterized protein n=2 Tax=Cherax quadricarinatus TaxID=27406 RepID=A0AAW0WVK4_CHEQU